MPSQTPNVFTYPRIEPGTQGHQALVEPLRSLPDDLAGDLRGITDAEATYRSAPESWCIKEHVGHLRDAVELYHKRLYMMSTQTDPVLEPAHITDPDYMERELDAMLADLREWRADTVQLLTTLVNWNWARTGQHLSKGRMSIRQMVEEMVEHEAEHLAGIRMLHAAANA